MGAPNSDRHAHRSTLALYNTEGEATLENILAIPLDAETLHITTRRLTPRSGRTILRHHGKDLQTQRPSAK